DALRFFDYVFGFTNREVVRDVLHDCTSHRPFGVHVAARQQPAALPGVRERWSFIEAVLKKAPLLKIVPMLGSLGCPYTCSFCIDSTVPDQPLDFDVLKKDLAFLLTRFPRLIVGWHDPNFGVRFDDYLGAVDLVRKDLGRQWNWLPEGALFLGLRLEAAPAPASFSYRHFA